MNGFNLIIKPDEEDAEAAEVFVDGTIGGHPYRFLLDTGAARSSVIFDDYTSTFDSAQKSSSSGVFADSSDDLITVPGIELGPISKANFTLVRKAHKDPDTRNLIGMDLLKDFCCNFYFDEHRISVGADEESGAGYALQDLFLDRKFHPYVDVWFGSVKANSVWDSGASLTIVDISFINRQPAFFQAAGRSTGTDATGATMETPMFVMSATVIGGNEFPPHRVAGVDLSHLNATIEVPMDLILGYSTLSKANWVFDFPHRRWAISKRLGVE